MQLIYMYICKSVMYTVLYSRMIPSIQGIVQGGVYLRPPKNHGYVTILVLYIIYHNTHMLKNGGQK